MILRESAMATLGLAPPPPRKFVRPNGRKSRSLGRMSGAARAGVGRRGPLWAGLGPVPGWPARTSPGGPRTPWRESPPSTHSWSPRSLGDSPPGACTVGGGTDAPLRLARARKQARAGGERLWEPPRAERRRVRRKRSRGRLPFHEKNDGVYEGRIRAPKEC